MARCAYVGAAFAALIAALVAVRLAGTQSGADLGTGTMFDRIAPHYDRANGVMSLGLHHGWRRALVDALDVNDSDVVLDAATGTADVALLAGAAGARVSRQGASIGLALSRRPPKHASKAAPAALAGRAFRNHRPLLRRGGGMSPEEKVAAAAEAKAAARELA
mmetsp:Transcript_16211/g.48792  ORF Transcript_16211/g.48792 Transcript_16211/m.48792 type:complete len:163 (+) Transcript_16211:439-927(+)